MWQFGAARKAWRTHWHWSHDEPELVQVPLANQRACVLVSPLWSVNPSNPFWERPYLHDNTIVLVSIVDLLLQFVVVWNISACNKPPRREGLATFYAKWIAFCAVYFFCQVWYIRSQADNFHQHTSWVEEHINAIRTSVRIRIMFLQWLFWYRLPHFHCCQSI